MLPPSEDRQARFPPPSTARYRVLRAGAWTMLLDQRNGALREICWSHGDGVDHEVLRGIYAATRDDAWSTLPTSVESISQDETPERTRVEIRASHGIETDESAWQEILAWTARITASADGMLSYAFEGRVRCEFRRNRIGLCVLHAAELAGAACTIVSTEGERTSSAFPHAISPHQPFRRVRAIIHEPAPGLRAETRCEGEVFETEDQRNWTDASFKTYSTPLDLPIPVTVREGDLIEHEVTVTLDVSGAPGDHVRPPGSHAVAARARSASGDAMPGDAIVLRVAAERAGRLPLLGLEVAEPGADGAAGSAAAAEPETARDIERLASLPLSHLRTELDLAGGEWRTRLTRAAHLASALRVTLELAVFASNAALLEALERALGELRVEVSAILLHESPIRGASPALLREARRILAGTLETALLGAGTDRYFAELNRGRPPIELIDLVTYSIHPQVHAFDDRSLIETLPVQATTLENARSFAGDRPICVSPITLGPRRKRAANASSFRPGEGSAPRADADPRQALPFAAAWTLASLRHLARAGAASLTYFETLGPRGLAERTTRSAAASDETSAGTSTAGGVYPVFDVFRHLGAFARAETLRCEVSHPFEIDALIVENAGRRIALLASYDGAPREVRIVETAHGHSAGRADAETRVRLDADRVARVELRNLEASR